MNLLQKQILDEQNKKTIEQLHATTLNISGQSFQIKKLCIVTLTSVSAFFKAFSVSTALLSLASFGIAITLLFYIVDSFMYYYQRNLRKAMIKEENEIYKRHNINQYYYRKELKNTDYLSAFFNLSHTIYYILIIIFVGLFIFNKTFYTIVFIKESL